MRFDGSKTADIDESKVVYRSVPDSFSPRVTVGLPTFNRPDTLKRALASIAQQTFRDFLLIISDNAGRDPATLEAVKDYAPKLPGVVLIAHEENKGALANLNYLLSVADTEFFMWLADDDEITETYLDELVKLLDTNTETVSAMGYWQSMMNPTEGYRHPLSHHEERNPFFRVMKYVAGPTDDAFFYGLHRTACLRQCRFDDYLFPNKGVLTNFCYVFLFDLILQGPICYTESAGWVCHNYSEKQYNKATALGFHDRLKTLARRINVYGLYCGKAFRKNPLLLPPVFIASVYGLTRDVVTAAGRISCRAISKRLYTSAAN